jgi:predicted PurR-regulated permease PerM
VRRGPAPIELATLALAAAALLMLVPLWAPLLLAAWVAVLAHPLHTRLTSKLKGSQRAAALVTVLVLLALVAPIVTIGVSVGADAVSFVDGLLSSDDGQSVLHGLVASSAATESLSLDWNSLSRMLEQHGTRAWGAARAVAGATTKTVLGTFVFVLGTYTFLVRGSQVYAWLAEHSPLRPEHTRRFGAAFCETGRGLFIGIGLTAVLQGAVATLGYFALQLPHAPVLGVLTVIAALIPAGGAALVWAPLTVALWFTDRPVAAAIMLGVGVLVSGGDNLVRPAMSRYGRLQLPMFLVLLAMLGGIATFGAWGLFLGPLFVRLAIEGLQILRDERAGNVVVIDGG